MATHTKETLLAIVEKLRYDTTNIQANITELARAIAALPIPEPKTGPYKCSYDGLTFPSAYRLGEHLHNVHPDKPTTKTVTETHNGPISGVALSHAHTAEDDPSSAGSDVSKLTCREDGER